MKTKVLTNDQLEQFTEQGFTYLRGGIPKAVMAPVLDSLWEIIEAEQGILRHDRTTWTKERVNLKDRPTGPAVAALYTQRVRDAFDDLLGQGRWMERGDRTGAWPIAFPGFADQWASLGNWHIDGGGQRTVAGGQQALIAIMLFNDLQPGWGGTAVRIGSHKTSTEALRAHEPHGISHSQFIGEGCEASKDLPVVEAQGDAGDLIICHGFLVHSGSKNIGPEARIITNNCITLNEPAVLNRANPQDHSVYERTLMPS